MSIAGVVDYKSILSQNNYKQVNNIDDANNLSKSISKNDNVVKNNTTDCVSISGSLSDRYHC